MTPVNFFYNNTFYSDVEELMIDLEIDEENIEEQPDFFKATKAELQPIVKIDADWIIDRIDEERFSESGDEAEKLYQLLKQIDFSQVNEKCPKLWYETYTKVEITKADLYEAL